MSIFLGGERDFGNPKSSPGNWGTFPGFIPGFGGDSQEFGGFGVSLLNKMEFKEELGACLGEKNGIFVVEKWEFWGRFGGFLGEGFWGGDKKGEFWEEREQTTPNLINFKLFY